MEINDIIDLINLPIIHLLGHCNLPTRARKVLAQYDICNAGACLTNVIVLYLYIER